MSIKPVDFSQMTAYELIDYLDKTNPRVLIQSSMTYHQLMFEGGRRDLVESLLTKKEREQNGNRHTEVTLR